MGSSISSSPVQVLCKGILFDMDGILISSLGSVERSWTKWAQMRGVDPVKTLRIAHGCRSIETVAALRPDLDAQAENDLIERLEMEDTDGITVLPGVQTFLKSLPFDRWTVVTSATAPLARVRLKFVGVQLPEPIVTADIVTHGKPHPEPYLAGAKVLGFAPEECVVFEDAASGANAGRAAGCTVIATTFSHSVQDLKAAHYLIPDLTAVTAEVDAEKGAIVLKFTPLSR
jgi:sugar-phosphatase